MRVLIYPPLSGAGGPIAEGWANAFRATGHVVARWDGEEATWKQFEPDLYLATSGFRIEPPADRTLRRADARFVATKIAFLCSPLGPMHEGVIFEAEDTVAWVAEQRIDIALGYGLEEDRPLWSDWTNRLGIPWVPSPTAGDSVLYDRIGANDDIDLAFVGGRWHYKAHTIDRYVLPLFQSGEFTYELYGWSGWPEGMTRGVIDDGQLPGLFQRARICPCVSEPHTQISGIDIPERMFKAALSGALVVHDPVPGLERYVPSALRANDAEHYFKLCKYWSGSARRERRLQLAAKQRREVLAGHTYFHRMAVLLDALDCGDEAQGMRSVADQIARERE